MKKAKRVAMKKIANLGKENEIMEDAIKRLEENIPCTCDLDRWQPEGLTGHTWVCDIHKAFKELIAQEKIVIPHNSEPEMVKRLSDAEDALDYALQKFKSKLNER